MKSDMQDMLKRYREAKVDKMVKNHSQAIKILAGIQSKTEKRFRERQRAKISQSVNMPEILDKKQSSLKTKLEAFNDRRKREFEEEYV